MSDQRGDGSHGDETDNRRFESGGGSYEVFLCEVCTVRKVFPLFNHADNLTSTSYTIFEDFDLAGNEAHQMRGSLPFAVDGFVLFVGLYRIIVHQKLPLFVIQRS